MKKTFKVTGATAGTVLVALSQISPAFADEVAKNKVDVKSEQLDAVLKEAAENGFTITTTKEKRVAKTQEEFEKLQSEAKADLDAIAAKIKKNVDADKQHKAKVKEAVDKVKNEEDEIKAKFPLIAEKDGVRVYGKFNEEKKGSQAYYENIHAFTDRDDITPIKDGIYVRQDSELTAEDGTKISKPSDTLGYTFLGEEGKLPTGSKVKVSHVADTLDGKRVDAHLELIKFGNRFTSDDGFKKFIDSKGEAGATLDDNAGVTSGKGYTQAAITLDKESGILYFYAFDSGGYTYKITYKTEDGSTINPMSALVNVDIDYNQGIATSEKNLITGILSPESELTSGDIYDTVGNSYKNAQYDHKGIVADYDKSIPQGSGIFITSGGEFEYSHFFASDNATPADNVEYTNNRMKLNESVSMAAGLFSKDVKVNLHTPEIPTAPAIEKEFEAKEIEVTLEQQPTTTYVDENGKQLLPPEKGEKDKKDIPGYKFVETKKKENGDIEHVYKKTSNITTYVEDKTGKELSPKDEGILEKKDIPEYEYVRTDKKENGDVEHVYRKSVTTTYVDENGNKLLPPEKGEKEKKDIPGYKFIETKKKENGDIEHIYKKVSKITTYVDESGKELLPKKEGTHEKEVITGYEFVKTNIKENGDVEHVYKQVSKITTYVDESGKELLPKKEGIHEKETINGYEFVKTVTKENGDVEHVYKKVTEKKLPATSLGLAGGIAGVLGLTGVGAYFGSRKRKK
jgi:surface repeat SSSPR-51 protein